MLEKLRSSPAWGRARKKGSLSGSLRTSAFHLCAHLVTHVCSFLLACTRLVTLTDTLIMIVIFTLTNALAFFILRSQISNSLRIATFAVSSAKFST